MKLKNPQRRAANARCRACSATVVTDVILLTIDYAHQSPLSGTCLFDVYMHGDVYVTPVVDQHVPDLGGHR